MKISEIIKDSLRYPFSDWKKFFIFVIIALITNFSGLFIAHNFSLSEGYFSILIVILCVVVFLGLLLEKGYSFRILKCSINGGDELPQFNAWIDMLKDGIKLSIVTIVYSAPIILIFTILTSFIAILVLLIPSFPNYVAETLFYNNYLTSILFSFGVWGIIGYLYLIIVLPIWYMSIATMAINNSELSYAFKFHLIINKISIIGWKKLIIWYIVTGILFSIIYIIGSVLAGISFYYNQILGILVSTVIIIIYLNMYIYRAIALFYISK